MTPPARPEYIITEMQVQRRLRPATAAPEEIKKYEEAAAAQAREDERKKIADALTRLYNKVNQRQMDVETEEGDIIEVIEKGEVLAWIDELKKEIEEAEDE